MKGLRQRAQGFTFRRAARAAVALQVATLAFAGTSARVATADTLPCAPNPGSPSAVISLAVNCALWADQQATNLADSTAGLDEGAACNSPVDVNITLAVPDPSSVSYVTTTINPDCSISTSSVTTVTQQQWATLQHAGIGPLDAANVVPDPQVSYVPSASMPPM